MDDYPTGAFSCEIILRRVRAPQFVQEERSGVTYLVARDYELIYDAVLRFSGGAELPITAQLIGELNQQLIIRDTHGRPVRAIGYTQGRAQISTARAGVIFRGSYYDSRVVQELAGDEALTPTGQRVLQHWQNGFGEGPYAGHAFSLGVRLTREGDAPALVRGPGEGQID